MRVRAIVILTWLCVLGSKCVEAQTETITNASQIAEAFNGDVFCLPIDPPTFQAWLIDPQFLWADFASLTEEFGTAFAESQETNQGLTVLKIRLTRSILTGETLVEFPSSTNTLTLTAPADYQTNQIDSASRSSLQVWRQYIEWGALDPDSVPTLRLDVALADIQDKPAYDAAVAAADADCVEESAMAAGSLGDMGMLDSEDPDALTIDCSATNAFQVVAIIKTVEGSMTIRWNSECNALYRIDYAPSLSTNTAWQTLYANYPSHGTSTFWTDTGDYLASPLVPHPSKMAARFYRVVKIGTNTSPPQVTLTVSTNSPLGGNVNVSVTATGAYTISGYRIFVDGDEVDSGNRSITNYAINTCEWSNGVHTLLAVADDTAAIPTTPTISAAVADVAASPLVSVLFSNYVSRFQFSEPFFEPDLGQTQNISAVFATNSNWTLTITNSSGATNRTVTGTGSAMAFSWDGTGDGGSSLASGVYGFTLSATAVSSGGSGTATSPLTKAKKVKGSIGNFGVAYQGKHPTNDATTTGFHRPTNGLGGYVTTAGSAPPYGPVSTASTIMDKFAAAISKSGWKQQFKYGDDQLLSSYLRKPSKGGTSVFNQVRVGLLLTHGIKGTSSDYTIAGTGPYETYMPIYHTGGNDYDWVRLSECDFGSTNLYWMCVMACDMLSEPNYQDMYDKVVLPINDNLHLLLSGASTIYAQKEVGGLWAKAMLGKISGLGVQTVEQAWAYAGAQTQGDANPAADVIFRVAGWPACFSDQLLNYSTPDSGDPANITFDDFQVYP